MNPLRPFVQHSIADPVYLPLFERVESELAAYEAAGDAISRARAIAARQRAAA